MTNFEKWLSKLTVERFLDFIDQPCVWCPTKQKHCPHWRRRLGSDNCVDVFKKWAMKENK